MELTIEGMIEHFRERTHQMSGRGFEQSGGREPYYPFLVVYLGEDAARAHPALSSALFQLWPPFRSELRFVGVLREGRKTSYIDMEAKRAESGFDDASLTEEQLRETVSALFGMQTHFQNRSRLLVYYVMDSTGFAGGRDFARWLGTLAKVRRLLSVSNLDMLDTLFLMLNENFARQAVAHEIRRQLMSFYEEGQTEIPCESVFLLSNRRSDNAIMEDWKLGYQMIAALIELSDNSEGSMTSRIFGRRIMTVSYAREEKPLGAIGQIVAQSLIDRFKSDIPRGQEDLPQERELLTKLGVEKDGTFALLNEYVEDQLEKLFPAPEQLEYFPRKDDTGRGRLAELSAEEFDELTMGAWSCYLGQIVRRAQDRLDRDLAIREEWSSSYRKRLAEQFTLAELIQMNRHMDEIRGLFPRTRTNSGAGNVLSSASEKLRQMLSSDDRLIDFFMGLIEEQGENACQFLDIWEALLRSRRSLFKVKDANMAAFYERKLTDFFDHQQQMRSEFSRVLDEEELREFLTRYLNRLIDYDDIFTMPFEEELEARLREEALPVDTKQYIRRKLTGESVHTYLQTDFSMGTPVAEAVLLKIDTPLCEYLRDNLPQTIYYYNTGNSDAAESIVIYEVSRDNLTLGSDGNA